MTTKPIKVYEKFVVVAGSGEFPLDVLRYDAAFPATQEDSHIAENHAWGPRAVALVSRAVNDLAPTEGLWQSHGWKVVAIFRERQEAVECRKLHRCGA